MNILKFGGTSVGDTHALLKVKKIIENTPPPCVIVVSAMSGVTDQLLTVFHMAVRKVMGFEDELQAIYDRHGAIAMEVLTPDKALLFKHELQAVCERLVALLHGIAVLKDSQAGLDYVLSMGEYLSSVLVSLMLGKHISCGRKPAVWSGKNWGIQRAMLLYPVFTDGQKAGVQPHWDAEALTFLLP